MLSKIIKVFATKKEIFKVLSYGTDLYFPKHKLAIEVKKLNAIWDYLDCKFIRINPDEKHFDVFVEIGKTYDRIVNLPEKPSIDKILKGLLKLVFETNHLIKPNNLKYMVRKMFSLLYNMQTNFLSCKKCTDDMGWKKVIMTKKVVGQALKCANCVAEKSRFLKQKSNNKTALHKTDPNFFIN